MKSAKMKTALAGTAIFLLSAGLGAQDSGFQLKVAAPARVTAGSDFSVTLRGSSTLDLLGYSAQITYDPAVLSFGDVEFFGGTVWEEADFSSAVDDPVAGAIVVVSILDQDLDGESRVVAAGQDLQFLNLGFQAVEVEVETATTIGFTDDIDRNLLADSQLAGHDTTNDLTLIPASIDIVPSGVRFLRGDCNGDGADTIQVSDAIFLLLFNFSAGTEPPCLAACDANGDGGVTGQVSDAVYMLLFSFSGGLQPVPPFPECGPASLPTDEVLGCESPPEGCQ